MKLVQNWTEEEYRAEENNILQHLAREGIELDSLYSIDRQSPIFKKSIPILLYWLGKSPIIGIKRTIAAILASRRAKGIVDVGKLIEIFKLVPLENDRGLRWALGNTISETATPDYLDQIIEVIKDDINDTSKEMLVIALGNMKDKRAIPFLIELLKAESLAGHAVISLGKLRAVEAADQIAEFCNHKKSWIRQEAKKALKRIEEASKK